MNEFKYVFDELKKNSFDLINDIQALRSINESIYNKLCCRLNEICLILKKDDFVLKDLLFEIYSISKHLENEAINLPDKRVRLLEMADNIRFYFELILIGETPDQRRPGIPRIV